VLFVFGKHRLDARGSLLPGLAAGCLLFLASSFQQYGIVHTTAGKAGFITGLYVVFVPLLGLFLGHRAGASLWMAVALAALGLFLLAGNVSGQVVKGDVLVLISIVGALLTEPLNFAGIMQAALPIGYAGIFSVGVAFTLQVVGQKHTHPTSAAIILSLEALFAVIGGVIILHEALHLREFLGCVAMLGGMVLAQFPPSKLSVTRLKRAAMK
jgi:drug/metabolite transporter (DMT)-like permease